MISFLEQEFTVKDWSLRLKTKQKARMDDALLMVSFFFFFSIFLVIAKHKLIQTVHGELTFTVDYSWSDNTIFYMGRRVRFVKTFQRSSEDHTRTAEDSREREDISISCQQPLVGSEIKGGKHISCILKEIHYSCPA